MFFTSFIFLIFSFLIRYYKFVTINYFDALTLLYDFRMQIITRLDSPTYGVLGALIYHYYNDIWVKFRYYFLVIGIVIFLFTKFPFGIEPKLFMCVYSFSLQSLSFLFILPFFEGIKTGKGYFFIIVTYISYISYSIYLINFSLIQLNLLDIEDLSLTKNALYLKYFLFIILSYLGSLILYKKVELPFMIKR